MANIIAKYILLDHDARKVIGSAQDLYNIVNQWHNSGESGIIVKVVTWKTVPIDITDAPATGD